MGSGKVNAQKNKAQTEADKFLTESVSLEKTSIYDREYREYMQSDALKAFNSKKMSKAEKVRAVKGSLLGLFGEKNIQDFSTPEEYDEHFKDVEGYEELAGYKNESSAKYNEAVQRNMDTIQKKISGRDAQLNSDFWLLANTIEDFKEAKNKEDIPELKEVKNAILMLRNSAKFIAKENENEVMTVAKLYLKSAAMRYLEKKGFFSFGEGKKMVKALLGKLGDEAYKNCTYAVTRTMYNINKENRAYTKERINDVSKQKKKENDNKKNEDFKQKMNNMAAIGGVVVINETYKDERNIVAGYNNGKMVEIPKDEEIIPDKLMMDDIRQGQCGNCYLLSALSSYIERNPEEKDDLIRDNGDTVTVRFFDNRVFSGDEYRKLCDESIKNDNKKFVTRTQFVNAVFEKALTGLQEKTNSLIEKFIREGNGKYDKMSQLMNDYKNYMNKSASRLAGQQSADLIKKGAETWDELNKGNDIIELNKYLQTELMNQGINSEALWYKNKIDFRTLNSAIKNMSNSDIYKEIEELYDQEISDEIIQKKIDGLIKNKTLMDELLKSTGFADKSVKETVKIYVNVSKKVPVFTDKESKQSVDAGSSGHNWVKLVEKAYALSELRNHHNDRLYDKKTDTYITKDLQKAYSDLQEYADFDDYATELDNGFLDYEFKKDKDDKTDFAEAKEAAYRKAKINAKERFRKTYANTEGGRSKEAAFHLTGIEHKDVKLDKLVIDEKKSLKGLTGIFMNVLKSVEFQDQDDNASKFVYGQCMRSFGTVISYALLQNKGLNTRVKVKDKDDKEITKLVGHRSVTLEDIKDSLDNLVEKLNYSELLSTNTANMDSSDKKSLYEELQTMLRITGTSRDKKKLEEQKKAIKTKLKTMLDSSYKALVKKLDRDDDKINLMHRTISNNKGMKVKYTKRALNVYDEIKKKVDLKASKTITCGSHSYMPVNMVGEVGLNGEAMSMIAERHAYTILNCEEIEGVKFLVLRNPWGSIGLRHELYSDGKDKIQLKSFREETQNGVFKMELNDFMDKIGTVDM